MNKVLVLFLALTFLGLTVDLRYEHVDKVRHHWSAWIPIAYSAAMVVVCPACLAVWRGAGRPGMFAASAAGLAVGGIGFWLHNRGHVWPDVTETVRAWTTFEHHSDAPPTLAPLAFAGLGVLGMVAAAVPGRPAADHAATAAADVP